MEFSKDILINPKLISLKENSNRNAAGCDEKYYKWTGNPSTFWYRFTDLQVEDISRESQSQATVELLC